MPKGSKTKRQDVERCDQCLRKKCSCDPQAEYITKSSNRLGGGGAPGGGVVKNERELREARVAKLKKEGGSELDETSAVNDPDSYDDDLRSSTYDQTLAVLNSESSNLPPRIINYLGPDFVTPSSNLPNISHLIEGLLTSLNSSELDNKPPPSFFTSFKHTDTLSSSSPKLKSLLSDKSAVALLYIMGYRFVDSSLGYCTEELSCNVTLLKWSGTVEQIEGSHDAFLSL